ncbi:MAG: pyridoxal kinase PdxY [Azospirillum sp.]|nr:pyridoxal kinase PdxY [Azospirillum sp.]
MTTILTLQSHVAFGHVGNRAAGFVLERLGCAAIAIDTVRYSNHTGHGAWTGEAVPAAELTRLLDGVAAAGGLARCDAVLSGYLGRAAVGEVVLDAVARVRAANPAALWCCDPVMGDHGQGLFVGPQIPVLFRDTLVPAADIVTPNCFELEVLTGLPVARLDQALAATAALRRLGPKLVLVTSLVRAEAEPGMLEMLVDGADGAWLVATPRLALEPPPGGAGDATAALFLARYVTTADPAEALAGAAAAIFGVLSAPAQSGNRDLALVESQNELVAPTHWFPPVRVG